MSGEMFSFNEQQLELLQELKELAHDSSILERLRSGRIKHIDKFREILDHSGFPDDDLTLDEFISLFWNMRRVMHNRALGQNLFDMIEIGEFNERLRILFDDELSLGHRVDQFLMMSGIGRVTTSHFLFMYNPEEYPLTTKTTRNVLDFDDSQKSLAESSAIDFYNVDSSNFRHLETTKLLRDMFIFAEIKEYLEVEDFYTVNRILWDESQRVVSDVDDIEESDDYYITASREDDLQNYLAANPELLEPGLQFIDREYQTGTTGRIDLLMRDTQGCNVIIETKRDRSSDTVVGQISRYMGWVSQNMEGSVRGIIVVAHPDERLTLAAAAHSNLRVMYYRKFYRLSNEPFST